jgi:hypothetical protein
VLGERWCVLGWRKRRIHVRFQIWHVGSINGGVFVTRTPAVCGQESARRRQQEKWVFAEPCVM